MRYLAIFTDIPDGAAIRAQWTPAHQAFLRQHKGRIRLAGAVRDEHGGTPQGGVWLFDTQTKDEADAIVRSDPFFVNGLRASYQLLAWGTAPGYEDVAV